jgi:hypothetical protein
LGLAAPLIVTELFDQTALKAFYFDYEALAFINYAPIPLSLSVVVIVFCGLGHKGTIQERIVEFLLRYITQENSAEAWILVN